MGLSGMLEDLPILDMLQIVAFSTKTGYLKIQTSDGEGVVIFQEGKIHCAVSPSTWDHVRRLATDPPGDDESLHRYTEVSLRELVQLRTGSFEFELMDELDSTWGDLDLSRFFELPGLNVQHSLLDLSRQMDEERRDAIQLVEAEDPASHAPPAASTTVALKPHPDVQVVLVDDEPDLVDVVGDEMTRHGYTVERAYDPSGAMKLTDSLARSGARFVVVSDIKMLTTNGDSFLGGLELVERLRAKQLHCPVILMTDSLPLELRQKAIELKVRKVSFKPTLTKPDPELYRDDLRAFARELIRQVRIVAEAPAPPSSFEGDSDDGPSTDHLEHVASMAAQIADPNRKMDVTRVVLQAAARWMDRGVLFLVRGNLARGLSAFGISEDPAESEALARQLTVTIGESPPFADVVRTGRVLGPSDRVQDFEGPIYSRIGQGEARQAILYPMLNHGEVITILYADNAETGRPLMKAHALEVILTQAGLALENLLLQRKLDALRSHELTAT